MRQSPPLDPGWCLLATAVLSLVLAGCEPFVGDIGLVRLSSPDAGGGGEDSGPDTDDDDGGQPPLEDLDAAPNQNPEEEDAGEAADAGGSEFDAGPPPWTQGPCVSLVDQSTDLGRAYTSYWILGCSRDEAGCTTTVDGTETGNSSIYKRSDGELLIQQGAEYSFRWTGISIFPKLRIYGGDSECSIDMLHEEFAPNFYSLTVPDGCSAFTAPVNARYVRLLNDYGVWFPTGQAVVFQLCAEPCP